MKLLASCILGLVACGYAAGAATANAEGSSLGALLNEAIEHNPEIAEAQKNHEAASALKGRARAPYFPELGLEAGAEAYRTGATSASNGFGSAFAR